MLKRAFAGNSLYEKLLYKPMTRYYAKLFAIILFAILQSFAPLLHAHFDTESHGSSGIHGHDIVESYAPHGEHSRGLEAKAESVHSLTVTAASAILKKISPCSDPAILLSGVSLWQSQSSADFLAVPLESFILSRLPFISPPSHAPPQLI